MTLPIFFRNDRERFIASYDWQDVITGNGFISFYPTQYDDASYSNFIMNTRQLSTMAPGGLIAGTETYIFPSATFATANNVKDDGYLTAYADGAITSLTVQLQIRKGSTSVIGTSTTTSAAEVTHDTTTNTLKKTITVNDFVNKVEFQAKSDVNPGDLFHKFFNSAGQSWTESVYHPAVAPYAAGEVENSNKEIFISKIEVWLDAAGTGDTVYYKDADVIAQDLNIEDISSEIVSGGAEDETILIPIPITKTHISIGDSLYLKLTKVGGGSIVLDPTNTEVTDESLRLDIPFKIDL